MTADRLSRPFATTEGPLYLLASLFILLQLATDFGSEVAIGWSKRDIRLHQQPLAICLDAEPSDLTGQPHSLASLTYFGRQVVLAHKLALQAWLFFRNKLFQLTVPLFWPNIICKPMRSAISALISATAVR